MNSLITEIVTELYMNNPDASPQEISNSLIRIMEREILPNAIKNIRLPSPPTPVQIWREELFQRRVKKKYRKPSSLKEKARLTQQFEYIKYELDGSEVDYSSVMPDVTLVDLDNPKKPIFKSTDMSTVQEVFLKKDGIPIDFMIKEESRVPYTKLIKEREIKKPPKFVITREIQNKIVSDSLYRDVLRTIEIVIRGFANTYPSKIDFKMSLHTDLEIPDWKKIVLSISVPDIDFDQKMILWDTIDAKIREVIHEMMSYVSSSERRNIEAINTNLFTRMELL